MFAERLEDARRALEEGNHDQAVLIVGSGLAEAARQAAQGDGDALAWTMILTNELDELTEEVLPPADRTRPWEDLRALAKRTGTTPAELGASLRLAVLHLRADNPDAATRYAETLIDLAPHNGVVQAEDFEIAGPEPGTIHDVLAAVAENLYYHHEKFAETESLARRMTELFPDSATPWYYLGHSASRLDHHEDAVAALSRLAELLPDQPGPLIALSRALYYVDRGREAVETATKAIELKPDDLQYRFARAQMRMGTGHLEQAVADLDIVIEQALRAPLHEPRDDLTQVEYQRDLPLRDLADFARITRLHLLVDLDRGTEAKADAHDLAATADEATAGAAHAILGGLAYAEGDFDQAVIHFTGQLDRHGSTEARLARAAAHEAAGRLEEAIADLDALSRQDRDPQAAVEALTELAERHPDHLGLRKALAHALLEAWRPAQAAELLEDVRAQLPDDWQVHAWLGMAQVTHSNEEEHWNQLTEVRIFKALDLLTEAVRLAPDEPYPRLHLRWLVERACTQPAIVDRLATLHFLLKEHREDFGLVDALPELDEPFTRWYRATRGEQGERRWARSLVELTAARAATEGKLPILTAMIDLRLADNYLRLYEVQKAMDHLASAEGAMVEIGRLPVMAGPALDRVDEDARDSGRQVATIDLDHLELSVAAQGSLRDWLALLRSQALQRIGDVDGALDEAADRDTGDAFVALHHRALLLRDAGRAEEALALLPELAGLVGPHQLNNARKLANLEATIHLALRDFRQAAKVMEQALKTVRPDSYDASVFVGNLITAYIQQGKARKALRLMERYQLPEGSQLPLVYGRHVVRAQALTELRDFRAALDSYQAALATADDLRGRLHDERSRMSWQERQLSVYEVAVDVALAAEDTTAALELVERSKARAFVDQLSLGHVEPTERTEKLRRNWERARRRYTTLETLAAAPDPASEIELRLRYRELNNGRGASSDDLARELEAEQSAVDRLARLLALEQVKSKTSVAGETLTGPEIHALLAEDRRCVLAEFFVAEDRTLLFVMTPDQPEPEVYEWDLTAAALTEAVGYFFDTPVRALVPAEFAEAFGPLLEPIADHCAPGDVVLLVPHGLLHYVPLHALLIERNPVCRVPSASLLRYRRRAESRQWRTAAVFGDSRGDLVHSRQEADLVASLFGAEAALGDDASRERLLAAVTAEPGPDLIHLACHGRFDDERAVDSAVLLADGRLTVEDIFQLSLTANLVTLSACESGVNANRAGDELIGLTRAVLYAGAPSLVVSLWEVDDLSTALLMADFYQRLRAGEDLAGALSRAQLALAATTARDVVDYCDGRLAVTPDPFTAAALLLDRARAQSTAGDLEAAMATCREVDAKSADVRGEPARLLRARAARQLSLLTLKAESTPPVDYGTRPFGHPYHWAAFVLVGDWR
ncbi:CHAT domain-containing protein/tetratricopeptide (TPR) repeat protein [Saccharothrix tamanrassetensis]|uniref:CHAT domain-containing protein/tetratricopeptide (TPR) repeat protein n=1 Tax=Saccharothrix tamanrassetensis TaxID=1051531 RepID=A0A841CHN0_9PSEU|nr:CHAT domain-containing protein [Saccharothrix tamanrassetensis]MBB5955515.1 CHAT domain-containing protein/tetratricopeptide (TPR) repeat protein [Saccharothrix tamanrassetensis]